MMQREIYIRCLQSFFRGRHGSKPRYKKSKRHAWDTVSTFEE